MTIVFAFFLGGGVVNLAYLCETTACSVSNVPNFGLNLGPREKLYVKQIVINIFK